MRPPSRPEIDFRVLSSVPANQTHFGHRVVSACLSWNFGSPTGFFFVWSCAMVIVVNLNLWLTLGNHRVHRKRTLRTLFGMSFGLLFCLLLSSASSTFGDCRLRVLEGFYAVAALETVKFSSSGRWLDTHAERRTDDLNLVDRWQTSSERLPSLTTARMDDGVQHYRRRNTAEQRADRTCVRYKRWYTRSTCSDCLQLPALFSFSIAPG